MGANSEVENRKKKKNILAQEVQPVQGSYAKAKQDINKTTKETRIKNSQSNIKGENSSTAVPE